MKARIYAYEPAFLDAVLTVLGKDRVIDLLLAQLRDSPESLALLGALKQEQWGKLLLDALNETNLRPLVPHLNLPGWQAVRLLLLQADPSEITLEKVFLSDPPLTSSLVVCTIEDGAARRYLDQLVADRQIAYWEEHTHVPQPSLRWLLATWPKEGTAQPIFADLHLRGLWNYQIRIVQSPDPYRLVGINDRSGKTVYSPQENDHGIATLDFSLEPGEALLLWVRRGSQQQIVATARLHQLAHVTVEEASGIVIQKVPPPGSVSLSP